MNWRTSAHQYLIKAQLRVACVNRSSSIKIQVPRGCPPPKIPSKSRSPEDVKVVPPVQGLVPLNPNVVVVVEVVAVASSSLLALPVALLAVGLAFLLNVDAIMISSSVVGFVYTIS